MKLVVLWLTNKSYFMYI